MLLRVFVAASLTLAAAACTRAPQDETRCPPLAVYTASLQASALAGLAAMRALEDINERDTDALDVRFAARIKAFYEGGPALRQMIQDYGVLRAQCRAVLRAGTLLEQVVATATIAR
jgi:hypothetical protein